MQKQHTVLNHDALDQVIFDQVSESKKIQELVQKSDKVHGAVQDVFSSLYKLNPSLREDAAGAQKEIIKNLMEMPEYKELCKSTRLDDIASAFGTLQLSDRVVAQVERLEKEAQKQNKSAEEIMEEMGDQQKAGFRQLMRRAIEQAQEDAEEAKGAFAAWGTTQGELQTLPFEKKFDLAQQLIKAGSLKRISELMGRFRNVLNSIDATKWSHGNDEIVDITVGDDLGRLLPAEYLKLKINPTLFYKDFLEKNLLQYNLKGVEPQGKGPIIVCLDVSGSMFGEREEWAKSVTLALLQLAQNQKRAFSLVTFEAKVIEQHTWASGTKVSLEDKIKIAQIVSDGGGTNYTSALRAAFEVRQKDRELRPADIVFITDGEYQFRPDDLVEIYQKKKELEIRVFGLGICLVNTECLKNFCDQISTVDAQGNIEAAKEVLSAAAAESKGLKKS